MEQPLLEIRNLKIDFLRDDEWSEVVHGIDFDVVAGRTLGIVGESGSGKSVSNLSVMHLLNSKQSRVKADAMLLEGMDIKDFSEKQMAEVRGKRIAMIFHFSHKYAFSLSCFISANCMDKESLINNCFLFGRKRQVEII